MRLPPRGRLTFARFPLQPGNPSPQIGMARLSTPTTVQPWLRTEREQENREQERKKEKKKETARSQPDSHPTRERNVRAIPFAPFFPSFLSINALCFEGLKNPPRSS